MELEQYNEETNTWERVEMNEETQLILDTMLAEQEIQEVIHLMNKGKEQNGTD